MRTSTLVICAVAVAHVYQAAIMLLYTAAVKATPLLAPLAVWHFLHLPGDYQALSAVMIISSGGAALGALARVGWPRLLLLIPQHIVLAVQAWGAWWSTFLGHSLDGMVMPWSYISADRIFITAIFAAHFHAILRRSRYGGV